MVAVLTQCGGWLKQLSFFQISGRFSRDAGRDICIDSISQLFWMSEQKTGTRFLLRRVQLVDRDYISLVDIPGAVDRK